jgi:hypothetical protein
VLRRAGDEDDEHWRFLVGTEYHHSQQHNNYVFHSFANFPRPSQGVDTAPPQAEPSFGKGQEGAAAEWKDPSTTGRGFLALHLVYENYKLSALRHADLVLLAGLNYRLASRMGWHMHADYYLRDFPHLFSKDLGTAEFILNVFFVQKEIYIN